MLEKYGDGQNVKNEKSHQRIYKREELRKYGLTCRRKLLLLAYLGQGKDDSELLAKELNLPLFIVRTEKVVTKFMGETGQKLSRIFDFIDEVPAVYLLMNSMLSVLSVEWKMK